MEAILAIMALAGAAVVGAQAWNQKKRRAWLGQLAAEEELGAQLADDGWIDTASLVDGRTVSVRINPDRTAAGASYDVSVYDLGIAPEKTLSLRPQGYSGSEDLKQKATHAAVDKAVHDLFHVGWTVDRAEITEGHLAIGAWDARLPEERRLKRVRDIHQATGALVRALEVALELGRPAEACPMCPGVRLLPEVGHLLEGVCPNCRGRFLSSAAVQQLFGAELGMSPGELKGAMSEARGLTCPGCKSQMGPVFLEDKILDLCPGCGCMWLDQGELEEISKGRYAELLGPIEDGSS